MIYRKPTLKRNIFIWMQAFPHFARCSKEFRKSRLWCKQCLKLWVEIKFLCCGVDVQSGIHIFLFKHNTVNGFFMSKILQPYKICIWNKIFNKYIVSIQVDAIKSYSNCGRKWDQPINRKEVATHHYRI